MNMVIPLFKDASWKKNMLSKTVMYCNCMIKISPFVSYESPTQSQLTHTEDLTLMCNYMCLIGNSVRTVWACTDISLTILPTLVQDKLHLHASYLLIPCTGQSTFT